MASMTRTIRRNMARNGYRLGKLYCPECERAVKSSGIGSKATCKCGYTGRVVRKKKGEK